MRKGDQDATTKGRTKEAVMKLFNAHYSLALDLPRDRESESQFRDMNMQMSFWTNLCH